MGYAVHGPIEQVDRHALLFALICVPGWLGGFLQIVGGYWNGRRDRIAGLPIAMTAGMLIHDSVFAVRFHHYFSGIGNLYWELYCVGAGVSVLVECVLIGQWVRYNADAERGSVPRGPFLAICLLGLGAGYGLFVMTQHAVGDPLDLWGTVLVNAMAVIPLVPWILSRRSARGQSRLFAFGTLIGPAWGGALEPIFLSPAFRCWQVYLLIAFTTALAVAYWLLYEHYHRADADADAAAARTSAAASLAPA